MQITLFPFRSLPFFIPEASDVNTPPKLGAPLHSRKMGDPFPAVAALYSSLPYLPFFASQLFNIPKSISPDAIMGSHSVGPVVGITFTTVGRCLLNTVAIPLPKLFNRVPTGCVARLITFGSTTFGCASFVVCACPSFHPPKRGKSIHPINKDKTTIVMLFLIFPTSLIKFVYAIWPPLEHAHTACIMNGWSFVS